MSATCQKCGSTWGGMRTEHCKVCHQTFTGTIAGDKHRVGDHSVFTGPARRRCLTPEEMRERGMNLNGHGVWTSGGDNPWEAA